MIGQVYRRDQAGNAMARVQFLDKPVVLRNSNRESTYVQNSIVFLNYGNLKNSNHVYFLNGGSYRPAEPIEVKAFNIPNQRIDLTLHDESRHLALAIGMWRNIISELNEGGLFANHGFVDDEGVICDRVYALIGVGPLGLPVSLNYGGNIIDGDFPINLGSRVSGLQGASHLHESPERKKLEELIRNQLFELKHRVVDLRI